LENRQYNTTNDTQQSYNNNNNNNNFYNFSKINEPDQDKTKKPFLDNKTSNSKNDYNLNYLNNNNTINNNNNTSNISTKNNSMNLGTHKYGYNNVNNNSYYSNVNNYSTEKINGKNYSTNAKPYEKKNISRTGSKEFHKGYSNYKFTKEYKPKTEEEKFNEMIMKNIDKARLVKRNGTKNKGYDDDNNDYIVVEHELIDDRYYVLNQVGKGSFGLVVSTIDINTKRNYAVKIIKNKSSFYSQAQIEIKILDFINKHDPNDEFNVGK